MENSVYHLGSFEACLEVGWVHFINLRYERNEVDTPFLIYL